MAPTGIYSTGQLGTSGTSLYNSIQMQAQACNCMFRSGDDAANLHLCVNLTCRSAKA